MKTNYNIY